MIVLRSKKQVEEEVRDIVVEQMGCWESDVQLDTRFKEDLGVDSLDLIELAMEFEKHFEITDKVTSRELEKIKTVGDVVDIISKAKHLR
jgi:acyl carrier protein